METVDVYIHKPLYGTFCYIRDNYIQRALRESKQLRIKIPQGTYLIDPHDWMKTAKKMEKVFNFPDNPMILWGNHVFRQSKQEELFKNEGGERTTH